MNSASSILTATFLNASGCTQQHKRDALKALAEQEDADIIGIAEMLLTDGTESSLLVQGYRPYFNSLKHSKTTKAAAGDQIAHKWGVLILLRSNLRVGEVFRPQGLLAARVILLSAFVEAIEVEPLWIMCIYAPVESTAQPSFFEDLLQFWLDHKLNNQKVIVMGDLNGRIL